MSETRVVWVLGAGFSKPLGGPLLNDLFSIPLEQRLLAATRNAFPRGKEHDQQTLESAMKFLRAVYAGGYVETHKDAADLKPGPWIHAEEFLEYVDAAASGNDPVATAIIERAWKDARARVAPAGPDNQQAATIAKWARRYLAIACHHFVGSVGLTERLERWDPYHEWARKLEPGDHVVSFNYDLVVERLASGRVQQFQPRRGLHNDIDTKSLLVKLHGSVDWIERPEKQIETIRDPWSNLSEGSPSFAIGTPGPNKGDAMYGLFSEYWKAAAEVIRCATHVMFVGYRMPESDARAREWLLQMLRNNRNKPRIHIVLGLQSDKDVDRLAALFRWGLPDAGPIAPEPLYAQDFLAVFDRGKLE